MAEFNGHFGEEIPPFQEAVDWFLAKRIVTRAEFDKLSAEMRAKAFTAARVYAADDLLAVYNAVLASIEQGLTQWDFTKEMGKILPRAWHRETVFRTNVLSAYGAGHYEQAKQVAALRPYWRYSAVMDGRTRPSHARLHGMVWPLDHPATQLFWPPWDYNCRCGATTLSQWEVDQEGLEVQTDHADWPQPDPKFQSPARGGRWEPDYEKYPAELAWSLREYLRAIYD